MTKSESAWWRGLVKYIIGAVLLYFVIRSNRVELSELFNRSPNLVAFIAAGLCYFIAFLTLNLRWYLLVRAIDLPFRLRNALYLGLVGTFYNTFLPGAVGGDFVKAFFIAKGQPGRRAAAVGTIIADRILAMFVLILFSAAVGGAFWACGNEMLVHNPKLQYIIWICVSLSIACIVGYTAIGFIPERFSELLTARLVKLKPWGPAFAELWFTVLQYRKRPAAIFAAVVISLISHTAVMFSFHYAVSVFSPDDDSLKGTIAEDLTIAPIGFIVQSVIPVPGGIGGGEFSFAKLYGLIRGPEGEAVGTAGRMMLRVVEWIFAFVGYIAFLNMKQDLPTTSDTEGFIDPLTIVNSGGPSELSKGSELSTNDPPALVEKGSLRHS